MGMLNLSCFLFLLDAWIYDLVVLRHLMDILHYFVGSNFLGCC